MGRKQVFNLKFRRRRESVTDYKKRLALVKSGIDRIVVRRTNKRIIGEVVRYTEKGDVVIVYSNSEELRKMKWPSRANRPTAYLTGMLLGSKAPKDREYILDIGMSSPVKNSIPFVFAKGCVDNGLKVRGDFKMDEAVYNGTQIAKYAQTIKGDAQRSKSQFTEYSKSGVSVDSLPKLFGEVREKIKSVAK